MLPRWHIILGAIFALILHFLFPYISWFNLTIIFLASFLIDFDHYLNAATKGGSYNLFKTFDYYDKLGKKMDKAHKKGIRKRSDFQFFHTIESHIFVGVLGLFIWKGFLFVLMGMAFHSILDVVYLNNKGYLYIREYSFINWILE